MLGAIGDLVEDVQVRLAGPIEHASDTAAVITRRRGGSAATVAVVAAATTGTARFIGQVGDDPTGTALVDALINAGVEPAVRRRGRTGSIVVLVHADGERTMLTDRGTSVDLDSPEPAWLDGLTVLHAPLYSLTAEPLATTTRAALGWARERAVSVSIDASSTAVMDAYGIDELCRLIAELQPRVLFANEDEARLLGEQAEPASLGIDMTVTHTAAGAVVRTDGSPPLEVPTATRHVADSTGAGDAFAAGFMTAMVGGAHPRGAAAAGHQAAARWLGLAGG